jgi:serine/threonine-protein kinase
MSDGLAIGSILIEEKLETSGSGEVWLGRQPALDRRVLVRKLRRDLVGSPRGAVDAFQREARLGAALYHPNVVGVFDCFAVRGDHYLVSEYVDGVDLGRSLATAPTVPRLVALRIALEIARGVVELHVRQIVHADLRPGHVLLSRWGEVKLKGLACARRVGEDAPGPTPSAYTAPEVVRGEAILAPADVFALGAILRELLAGRGAPMTRPRRRRFGAAGLADRCMADDPAKRPSAREVVAGLEAALGAAAAADGRFAIAVWLWESRIVRPRIDVGAAHEAVAADVVEARPRRRRWPILAGATAGAATVAAAAALAWLLPTGTPAPAPVAERAATPAVSAPAPGTPARISFVAHPWAEIRVGDRPPFTTPRAQPLELAPGSYTIVFRHPRFGEEKRTLTFAAGERSTVRHVFAPAEPR